MWIWTFALDDGSVLRATIQLTSRVECVYLGEKLVSRLRKGSRTAHELDLQPSPDPAATPYRGAADAQRRAQLRIDTRARSCTLTIDGASIVPSSFAEVSGVRNESGPPATPELPSRQRNRIIGGAFIFLSLLPLLKALLDLDLSSRDGHHRSSTTGLVLGITLATVGIGFAAAGIWGARGHHD
jgi:hypothetical protein